MDALKRVCLGCASHLDGDPIGQLLAAVCLIPYFAYYHCGAVFHARRELHVFTTLLGMLLNVGLGVSLKLLLRQPRPAATCAALGNCHKHGMPSSHAQVMAFVAVTCFLLDRRRRQFGFLKPQQRATRVVEAVELLLLAAATVAVAFARVYLGYHSPAQVVAGAALGAAAAWGWFAVTMAVGRPLLFPALLRLAEPLGLGLRDTLPSSVCIQRQPGGRKR